MDSNGIIGVVVDAGSKYTKAGFAGEAFPRAVLPTATGRFRRAGLTDGFPDVFCGQEAIEKRGISNLSWPVQEGFIKDWEEMEKLWFFLFYKELHIPPEQVRILHSVHPLVPRGDREKMTEILFESFAVNALNLVKSPALALYACGRTTGVVCEFGYSASYVAPVFEGYTLKYNTITSPITGKALSEHLQKLLREIGYSFTTPLEMDIVDKIKKDMCYMSADFEAELEKDAVHGESSSRYELPDGQQLTLGDLRFKCPELFYKPSLLVLGCPNIVDTICNSIDKCDMDYRKHMYENIVISGGSSMFPGFADRLHTEMMVKRPKRDGYNVGIEAMASRQYSSWSGGSMCASLECLEGFWITKREYEDVGPDRVNYKFF